MSATISSQLFFKILSGTRFGTVEFQLPDGKVEALGEGLPKISVQVRAWKVFDNILRKSDLGMAESIIEGDMVVDNMPGLIEWFCRNEDAMKDSFYGTFLGTLVYRLRRLLTFSTRQAAKQNIMAHYDLGNDFYRLWLDPTMTYSSAIFLKESEDLSQAQTSKYDRLIECLDIRPGDKVLEVGCGWGGFFSRAVEKTGCHVTAVMNSPEQARHNAEMIESRKFKSHVDLKLIDYRDIQGKFDKIVSIEMVEAVGEKNWPAYFGTLKASLRSRGSAMVQSITIRPDLFETYRKSTDFIQQYIFPGGMLLTNKIFAEHGATYAMPVTDIYEFGISYAETLKRWRENFSRVHSEVRALGFDDKFLRMWDLYFCYCEGAFRAQRINVAQFRLENV